MKRFLHLICSDCKRTVDKLVDNTHFAPDRCTITLRCEGRLFPVDYRSNATIAPIPVVGLTDWRPRGTSFAATSAAPQELTLATTGQSSAGIRRLVIAVRTTAPISDSSIATLLLNKRVETATAFSQFIYRRDAAFSSIEGVESGLEKKTLSYNTDLQTVDVYLNGIKLRRGTAAEDYSLFPDAGVLQNSVRFNTPIALAGITQVDVVISPKSFTSPTSIQLHRNIYDASRVGTGAWENVDTVFRFVNGSWQTYYLFTADIGLPTAQLELNASYTVNPTLQLDSVYSSTDAMVLLAYKPYSSIDLRTTVAVPLVNLTETNELKYSVVAGEKELQLPVAAITTVYPQLRCDRFKAAELLSENPGAIAGQLSLDNSLVIGPDT